MVDISTTEMFKTKTSRQKLLRRPLARESKIMRYIAPVNTIGNRFRNKDHPNWDVLVIIFRDRGSRIIKEALNAQDYGSSVFSGIDSKNTSFLTIENLRVGVIEQCIWGGPQAGILVEESSEIGIKTIIGIGACGSLSKKIHKGSLVVAKNSYNTDGTSKIYQTINKSEPSNRLLYLAKSINHFSPMLVQAVCTDALYRETKELVDSFIKIGGEVINMESSALYAASMLCKVESLWIGCVSDSLVGDEWQDWSNTNDMSYQSGLFCKEILKQLSL